MYQQNSIYEYVDNDIFVNLLMDQQQQQHPLTHVSSNPNFYYQYPLMEDVQEIKIEEPMQQEQPKKKSRGRKTLEAQEKDLFTYKNNLKNTYINKITSLMSQEQVKSKLLQSKPKVKPFEDEMIEPKSSLGDGEDNTNAKLIRNRECARNSRKRKKIYIELLENRVKSLNEELDKTKRILKTSASYFSKMSQNQHLQGFFLGRQQLYEKLEQSLKTGDPNELNLLLDSMRFRVGGGGKERVNASNYFFNQILDICFPIHVRYMLWSASSTKDLFGEEVENTLWTADILKDMDVTEAQRKQIKKSQRRIVTDKNKLEDLLKQFCDIKEQLYTKTSQLENFIDELRNTLSPVQVAKFLIGLEKNKYRKEMSINKLWDIFDGPSENDDDIKEEDSEDEFQQQKKVHI
ncbi:hypothetical protein pb186bvf_016984 [Paramecium bursaria]